MVKPMWETPVYRFKKQIQEDEEVRDLVIDVTGSAPSMEEPGQYLEGVFGVLTHGMIPKQTRIIDIGAAKLRNTLYLLKKGFIVYSVEFPELAQHLPQAKANWKKAETYPNFKKVIFPKDFFQLKAKVDLALMINVVNVMPIPEERLVLLSLTRDKMKTNGIMFWYGWRDIASNPSKYTPKTQINDGYFKGHGRAKKTFHGEWTRDCVFNMAISSGFSHDSNVELPNVGNNQAYVFRADRPQLLSTYLSLELVRKGGMKRDDSQPIPETGPIFFPGAYVKELQSVRAGRKEQALFHRISERLISSLFDHQLRNPVIEKEVNQGRGRVDIRYLNRNEKGFFKNLKDMRDILCPTISVECKNYHDDIGNPEFDQLAGRLNDKRGRFGLLICRKVSNRKKTIGHCHDHLDDDKYIVVLDDRDMVQLSKFKEQGDDEVDDFMERKIEEVVD